MNKDDILTVKRFSGAGMSECKNALEKSSSDVYLAIKSLISIDRISELHRDLMIRNISPESIKNPPDKAEYEIINKLYNELTGNEFKIESKNAIEKKKPWYRIWLW